MKKSPHVGLARKYRPQTFEEVVGQEAAATTLRNAIESKQMAHAYLFFGPKGVGKTTMARILAKALNCKDGPTPKPCGACSSCTETAAGSSIDVLELDAASNTQVDKIREMIIETVSLAPSRDRSKVFIIDEVHMLSTSSFNALLKTLEEPPGHVVFILATTELAKIPATIVSRCQRFRFRPLPRELMAGHLRNLAKSEKIKAEDKVLELLARAAGGSLRDAVSLFDQAAAYGDGSVTLESVAELMGTLPEELLAGATRAILGKDASALSVWLSRLSSEGFDPGQFLRDLRERFQGLYLHRLGAGEEPAEPWKELAAPHGPETFSFLLKRLNKTLEEMRATDSPQLTFELGMYGMLEAAYDLRQWVERLEALEKRLSSVAPASPPAPRESSLPQPSAPEAAAKAPEVPPSAGSCQEIWSSVLHRLDEQKPLLAASLNGSRLLSSEGEQWRLAFRLNFNLERAKASQAVIESELAAVAGKPIRLAFELAEPGSAASPRATAQAAQADKAVETDEQWMDAPQGPDAAEDPNVKKILHVMGGRVKQVKKDKK